ncbi:DUF397 domain-containing protein [Streptomyces sp. NPDC002055]|uniref:DUF397 domain-containing protein n=1 Tax=Streptomyces sp. NPDC002055 TaxID=3154534 RepID=UPI0033318988
MEERWGLPELTGAQWRMSSCSGDDGGQCVEVAAASCAVAVRDSKDPNGPALTFSPDVLAAFVSAAARCEFRAVGQ